MCWKIGLRECVMMQLTALFGVKPRVQISESEYKYWHDEKTRKWHVCVFVSRYAGSLFALFRSDVQLDVDVLRDAAKISTFLYFDDFYGQTERKTSLIIHAIDKKNTRQLQQQKCNIYNSPSQHFPFWVIQSSGFEGKFYLATSNCFIH